MHTKNDHTLFVNCECHTEGILITEQLDPIDADTYGTFYSQSFYVAMYRLGQYQKKPGFWQRLRYAWYHIKTGKIYNDQVILSPDEALQISEFLEKRIRANTKS